MHRPRPAEDDRSFVRRRRPGRAPGSRFRGRCRCPGRSPWVGLDRFCRSGDRLTGTRPVWHAFVRTWRARYLRETRSITGTVLLIGNLLLGLGWALCFRSVGVGSGGRSPLVELRV